MRKLPFLKIALVLVLATTVHAQTHKVLYNFGNKSGDPTNLRYVGTISQSHGGYMLSTSDNLMTDGVGTAFRITSRGTLTVLHRFSGTEGQTPRGGLTLATDGNFYGTTEFGGASNWGTIFKMTPQGSLTTLYSFTGGPDGRPNDAPIQSMGGDLYGTTYGGGDPGSVYKITRSGKFTRLHAFAVTDGAQPIAPLVQGNDGYFYGTTLSGGTYGYGTIFRISATGNFRVLHNFNLANGSTPFAPLIQAADGNLYGVTAAGGSHDLGVVFKMTPSHKLTVLHSFNWVPDGGAPIGGLMEATDGNLYGTATYGGGESGGVLFRITPTGTFTVLHNFSVDTGNGPQTTLFQHTNGILYGFTIVGGTAFKGTFYSFDLGLPPFISFLPVGGRVGARVQILGQGFTGTTAVSFNGVPATSFNVSLSTYMTAIVPEGATTGFITVTTPSGTLKSNKKFLVWP